jgi:hypothetical protein
LVRNRSRSITGVLDVKPEDVVGEVELLELAMHLHHVLLILVSTKS